MDDEEIANILSEWSDSGDSHEAVYFGNHPKNKTNHWAVVHVSSGRKLTPETLSSEEAHKKAKILSHKKVDARQVKLARGRFEKTLHAEGLDFSEEELDQMIKDMDTNELSLYLDELDEAWDTGGKPVTHKSRAGMFTGVSDSTIKKELAGVKEKMQAHKDEGNSVPHKLRTRFSQLTFALRARGAGGKRWGAV